MTLVAYLRFMRKHALSAIQLFLMWRHVLPSAEGSTLPEMADIPESLYARLPRAPAPNALFSDGEIEAVIRLTHGLQGVHRLGGWALANRCVWERLAPDHFPNKVASTILREAYDSDDLANWVGRVMQKDHPHYAAVFDQVAVDVVRATHPYYVDEADFKAFLNGLKAESPAPHRIPKKPQMS